MATATRLAPKAFPRVQRILSRPIVFAAPLIVFTELGLSKPGLDVALTTGRYYDRITRALVKYVVTEAQGVCGSWPRILNHHPEIGHRFFDSLERLGLAFDMSASKDSGEERLGVHDSRELWEFINHLELRRHFTPTPATYTMLKRTVDAVEACAKQGKFSNDGPFLFWDLMATREAQQLLKLPHDQQECLELITKAASKATSLIHPTLFAKYQALGKKRLG